MGKEAIARRKFVEAALSVAAAGSFPIPRSMAAGWRKGLDGASNWRDEGVLYLDKSPHAKLQNVPVHAVTITNGFWGARRAINVKQSIPSMERLLEANGRMTNFLRLAKQSDAPQQG